MADVLTIKTLGGLSIRRNDRAPGGFASRKAEALLVYLACNPRPHPRETLADLLWDDRSQSQAMTNLRVVLASLRKEVGPFVEITRQTAAIQSGDTVWLDAAQVDAAVACFRQEQTPETAQKLADALVLYAGEFLQGFSLFDVRGLEEWMVVEREWVHGLAVDGYEALGGWFLARGEFVAAIATSNQLLKIGPLSEAGHRQLMEALARAGRRGEALGQYERARQALWDELGLEPSAATQALAAAIQQGELEGRRTATAGSRRHNPYVLPVPATPLIGRQSEMAEIGVLLADSARVLSIVGPGGMGKTRLALEAAQGQTKHFDGVAFVDLAPVSGHEGIVPAIAQSLDFSIEGFVAAAPKAQLLNHLREKSLLLLLDNFEHLLEGAALLTEIVEAAPEVKLLVTSREALKLHVEQVYPLQGLATSDWETIEEAAHGGAAALFLHHARRSRPSYALRTEDLQPLRELLELLEGMPLAVILAAGWTQVLSPAEILAETARSLDFLESTYGDLPARQRSMRAVFHTTWAQLGEQEQSIFAALSVFRGGFTLDAAREVAFATPQELLSLVHHSLLSRREGGRFAVHELLRQFAAEALARSPEVEGAVRERHSVYYCRFLYEREVGLKSGRAAVVVAEITGEFQNVLIAANWAAENRRVKLLEQSSRLVFYCARQGRITEAATFFQKAAENLQPETAYEHRVLGFLIGCRATFTDELALRKKVREEAMAHLVIAAGMGEDVRYEEGWIPSMLGQYEMDEDYLAQRAMFERSLSLFQELNLPFEIAASHDFITRTYTCDADYVKAREYGSKAVQLWEEIGDPFWLNRAKVRLVKIKAQLGESVDALETIREAIAHYESAGNRFNAAFGQWSLSLMLVALGRFAEAERAVMLTHDYFVRIANQDAAVASQADWCWTVLHQGDFKRVWIESQTVLAVFRDLQLSYGVAGALMLQGCAALSMGMVEQALRPLETSVEENRRLKLNQELSWVLPALCCAVLLSGGVPAAWQHARDALQLARKIRLPQSGAMALTAVALLLAVEGQKEKALEIYALACRNPFIANSRWYEEVVGRRLADVAGELPPEVVAAARERGEQLELWEVVGGLCEELAVIEVAET